MSPDSASLASSRSDPLYAALEERVMARDQKGASEVYYKLAKAGRPLTEMLAEAVRIHGPYTHVPYHERMDDGYVNFVNNDHCLLSARATVHLSKMLPDGASGLPMDIRMMASSARIGFVFNKRGMAMEAGSCWFLPRLVGMQQAQEWVMTAELFGAEEALKGGLVRSIHAPEELLPAAQALARKFAASTSSAVAAAVNRRLMWSMLGAQDPSDALMLDLQCVGYMAASGDA